MERVDKKEIYRKLIESIDIKKIYLLELMLKRTNNEPTEGLNVKVNPSFELLSFQDRVIETQAKISVKAISKETNNVFFSIDATFQVNYELRKEIDGVDEEIVDIFVNQNLPINIWPYMRELVSSHTTKMGLPPLVLGVFKKFV